MVPTVLRGFLLVVFWLWLWFCSVFHIFPVFLYFRTRSRYYLNILVNVNMCVVVIAHYSVGLLRSPSAMAFVAHKTDSSRAVFASATYRPVDGLAFTRYSRWSMSLVASSLRLSNSIHTVSFWQSRFLKESCIIVKSKKIEVWHYHDIKTVMSLK